MIEVRRLLNEAVIDDRKVRLTRSQVNLLYELVRAKGKSVSMLRLERALWNEVNRKDKPTDTKILYVHLSNLRKALAIADTPYSIVPVGALSGQGGAPATGYRLTGPH